MRKAKAELAKPQQVRSDDPGLVAWVAKMAAVADRNRVARAEAMSEGATHYLCEQRRRGEDGQMHPYFEDAPVDPPQPVELDDEAIDAINADIDRVQKRNRRYLAKLKPHELARLETWLRTRSHASAPPVRPTSSPSIGCPPSRDVRNGHGHGDRRGERPRSSSSDDPDPDPIGVDAHARRLCAFCNRDLPAGRSPRALYCSDAHADRDRQRRKRQRDRARSRLPSIPTTADYQRMREITPEDRKRLLELVLCRCNGRHLEFDPGECFRCGHRLPRSAVADKGRVGA